jgi:hypothetical protein
MHSPICVTLIGSRLLPVQQLRYSHATSRVSSTRTFLASLSTQRIPATNQCMHRISAPSITSFETCAPGAPSFQCPLTVHPVRDRVRMPRLDTSFNTCSPVRSTQTFFGPRAWAFLPPSNHASVPNHALLTAAPTRPILISWRN